MDDDVSDPRHLGRLEHRDGRVTVDFTRRFPYPASTLWRALTEPEHLAAWFPTTIEGERVEGAPLRFVFRDDEAAPFEGEMLAYDPPRLMEVRWGDDVLRFEIEAHGGASVLTLTVTFEELGKVARDGAGWHACLDLLGCAVAGEVAPWTSAERWKEVHGTYVERFGAEASTIGPPQEWEQGHGTGGGPDER
jgi:uncharacterized protein YndB with AHSA1/START domain